MFECLTIDTIKRAITQLPSESPLESWMREKGYSVDSGGIVIIPKAWADAIKAKGISLPQFVRVSPRLQDRAILSRDQLYTTLMPWPSKWLKPGGANASR